MNAKTSFSARHVSHDSPKVHPARVKHGKRNKQPKYREKEELSLYIHPFTPAHTRTRVRVSA